MHTSEYRVMLGAALTVGVTLVEAKEIVYQAVPYVGMARVLDFLHITNDVLTERGVELPLEGQSTTTPETRLERGLAVQKEIVGEKAVDAMYANAANDEKRIPHYLLANCFGDYLTRTGLSVPDPRTCDVLDAHRARWVRSASTWSRRGQPERR